MRPADPSNKINVTVESSTGLDNEEHLLCNLHLAEYKNIKKKRNAGPEF
jgi:hypothetical protein